MVQVILLAVLMVGVAFGQNPVVRTPGMTTTNQVPYVSGTNTVSGSDILSRDGTNRRNVMTRAGTETDPIANPSAPTATLIATGTGNLSDGAYVFCMSYISAQGETGCSVSSNSVTSDASHRQITVSGLGSSCPTGATAKNLYATQADAGSGEEMAIPGMPLACATSTYTYNTPDGSLGVFAKDINTTAGWMFSGTDFSAMFSNQRRIGTDALNFEDLKIGASRDYVKSTVYYDDAPAAPGYPAQNFTTTWFASHEALGAGTDFHDSQAVYVTSVIDGTGNYDDVSGILIKSFANSIGTVNHVDGATITPQNGTATANNLIGVRSQPIASAASTTVSGYTSLPFLFSTTTNAHGFRALSPPAVGGTVTNYYGVKVEDATVATNNWAIKTGLGKVEFGDNEILDPIAFGSLGTPPDGSTRYCTSCAPTSGSDDTAIAGSMTCSVFRVGSVWTVGNCR